MTPPDVRETSAAAVAAWATRKAAARDFGGVAKELGYHKIAPGQWQHPATGHTIAADASGWRHYDNEGNRLAMMRAHQMDLFAGEASVLETADAAKKAWDTRGRAEKTECQSPCSRRHSAQRQAPSGLCGTVRRGPTRALPRRELRAWASSCSSRCRRWRRWC